MPLGEAGGSASRAVGGLGVHAGGNVCLLSHVHGARAQGPAERRAVLGQPWKLSRQAHVCRAVPSGMLGGSEAWSGALGGSVIRFQSRSLFHDS